MKKKYIRVFLLITLLVICILTPLSFATSNSSGSNGSDFVNELRSGMDPGNSTIDPTADSRLLDIVALIFSAIQYIGTGISIIVVMRLGIIYMFTSVEERAEIKRKAVPILIGSILIVATVNIMKLIQIVIKNSL